MKLVDFVRPTRTKLVVSVLLVLYVLASTVFLSQFNTTRSLGEREYTFGERVGMFVAYPAASLAYPFFYIGQYTFTGETTLRQLYVENGAVGLPAAPDPQYDRPLRTTTAWGVIAGLVGEVVILYILACILVLLMPRKKKSG